MTYRIKDPDVRKYVRKGVLFNSFIILTALAFIVIGFVFIVGPAKWITALIWTINIANAVISISKLYRIAVLQREIEELQNKQNA